MSDSDSVNVKRTRRNSLHALAAVAGVLIGGLLLVGAYGHFAAVWPMLGDRDDPLQGGSFGLLLPGLILAISGVINIAVCRWVWGGMEWSVNLALAANVFATIYLAYQLFRGVPDHPIGVFLALVSSYALLLAAIRMGLVWPALESDSQKPTEGGA